MQLPPDGVPSALDLPHRTSPLARGCIGLGSRARHIALSRANTTQDAANLAGEAWKGYVDRRGGATRQCNHELRPWDATF